MDMVTQNLEKTDEIKFQNKTLLEKLLILGKKYKQLKK